MNKFFLGILLLIVTSCKTVKFANTDQANFTVFKNKFKKRDLSEIDLRTWYFKDIQKDTIPGISLDRTYNELLKDKIGDTVIIGLLDTRINTKHEKITDNIWVNSDEIPDNGIDDDNNGYIDDIHGWNFLGNSSGKQIYFANFDYVRLIRFYENNVARNSKDAQLFSQYKDALREKESMNKRIKNALFRLDSLENRKEQLVNELSTELSITSLNEEILKTIKVENQNTQKKISELLYFYSISDWIEENKKSTLLYKNFYLNEDYNEREITGDNPLDINDINYGNNIVISDNSEYGHTHALKVAGVISAKRDSIEPQGITNNVKIIPISVSPRGDEQSKDIALGIKYAVDNGAKIINITFTKYYSIRNDWILEAIKYAEIYDVLIVVSSGNHSKDLDLNKSYPNDVDIDKEEICKNLIVVGASTSSIDENLVADFSNYGKQNVDIFAPGDNIFSIHSNSYVLDKGTSYASPVVSGVAALIRSYYPNLSAAEVKQIIMESGVSYDIMVNKPSTNKEKELVPFSSLSKSGKIVNAYNALLMAEEVSKKKKKKKKS